MTGNLSLPNNCIDPVFLWQGKNQADQLVTGCDTATNADLLKLQLMQQGIIPTKIRKKNASIQIIKRINKKNIHLFTRQLATLITAGIPIIQALDIIARGQTHSPTKNLYLNLKNYLEQGYFFSDALAKYPKYFSDFFITLIYAGEQSGTLDRLLERIANHQEKTEFIKRKVKQALYYPVAVVAFAVIITTLLLIWVVPQFQTFYTNLGTGLPVPTQFIINLSHLLQISYGYLLLFIITIISLIMLIKYKIPKFALWCDSIILYFPIIGLILKKAIISRFARTLASTFAAGLPIVNALQIAAKASNNLLFSQAILHIQENVAAGQQLYRGLQPSPLFPQLVTQMVAIGEESGSLEQMLLKIADFYEADVDKAIDTLNSLIEPVMIVVLGMLIGGLVMAMYLPLFKLGSIL